MQKSIQKFLKNFDWSLVSILKVVLVVGLVLLVLSFVLGLLGGVVRTVMPYSGGGGNVALQNSLRSTGNMVGEMAERVLSLDIDGAVSQGSSGGAYDSIAVAPSSPQPYPLGGDEAEEYEVTEYSAHYRPLSAEKVCEPIAAMKALEYVVFDSADESAVDGSCYFSFRVEKDHEEDIVANLQSLDPRTWNENTYTIERSVEDQQYERDLLITEIDSLEQSLAEVEAAYSDLMAVATNSGDAEALAKAVNDRLVLMGQLEQQIRYAQERLARFERSGDQQEDKMEYAHFNVSVSDIELVDWRGMGDSWIASVRDLARAVNSTLQGLIFGLLAFALFIIQALVYLFLLVVVAKFAWIGVKFLWYWEPRRWW